jgi:hypothetical protein
MLAPCHLAVQLHSTLISFDDERMAGYPLA